MVSYRHGFNVFDDTDIGARSIVQNAAAACFLGSNTLRIGIRWDELQPTSSTWSYTKIEELRQVVLAARTVNPQVQVLPFFDAPPAWAYGQRNMSSNPAPYSYRDLNTTDLYNAFGYAASVAMKYLNGVACPPGTDYVRTTAETSPPAPELPPGKTARPIDESLADFIEVLNEPNITTFGKVSAANYSGMATYTLYWVRSCLPTKRVLIGSLACDYAQNGVWLSYFNDVKWGVAAYLVNLYGSGWTTPYAEWRLSFHPYPKLGSPQSGSNPADNTGASAYFTVSNLIDAGIAAKPNNNSVWITETGASTRMTGNTGNPLTEQNLFTQYLLGYIPSKAIEGAIWWTLSDNDPQARQPASVDPYSQVAVLTTSESGKPAAVSIQGSWI